MTQIQSTILSESFLAKKIFLIRGHKVMLDSDLAELYGVSTKVLNQAVRRNLDRFPADFMFQLNDPETRCLRSQFVTLDTSGRGKYSKYLSFVFTEHGVAMLSSVLRSSQAIQVNIGIMRAFAALRKLLATHQDLAEKLAQLEKRYDKQFKIVFEAIRELMTPPDEPKEKIGFRG